MNKRTVLVGVVLFLSVASMRVTNCWSLFSRKSSNSSAAGVSPQATMYTEVIKKGYSDYKSANAKDKKKLELNVDRIQNGFDNLVSRAFNGNKAAAWSHLRNNVGGNFSAIEIIIKTGGYR